MRFPPTPDAELTRTSSDPPSDDFPSPETILDRGLWRARESAATDSAAPDPLEWVPAPSLRERIFRAVTIPAVAGGAVFVAAVVIAIIVTVLQVRPTESLSAGNGASARSAGSVVEGALSEDSSGADAGETADSSASATAPAPGGAEGAAAVAGRVTVHVVGEVVRPGVLEVAAGTRVGELVDAAGGATDAAVLAAVNLARPVVDGEQVVIPNAESVATVGGAMAGSATAGAPPGAAPSAPSGSTGAPPVVNLNTADLGALDTLPGVGPAIGQRILDWRQANGNFRSVDQLLDVPGVGEKMLAALRAQVTV